MRTLSVKFVRYLTKVHGTLYLALPREYTSSLRLEKDCKVELTVSKQGALILTPIEEAKNVPTN